MLILSLAQLEERLSKFRKLLTKHKVNAYVLPHTDNHFSEYLAPCHFRMAHISGFDGSQGTVVVTEDEAFLWTDGRYYSQAEEQIGLTKIRGSHTRAPWTLMKAGLPGTPTVLEWLKKWQKAQEKGNKGAKVGVDPLIFTHQGFEEYSKDLASNSLVLIQKNLVDLIWPDRPARPTKPLRVHASRFHGLETSNKIAKLQAALKEKETQGTLISMLDQIAWMVNLRGDDIPYNPVFFSYLWVPVEGKPILFTDGDVPRIDDFQIRPYDAVHEFTFPPRLWVDAQATSKGITQRMDIAVDTELPVAKWKGIKNEAELEGMRQAHIRDGAAKTKWLMWLQENWSGQTEVTAADKLEWFRSRQEGFVGLSFPSISGMGANGAIVHYHPGGVVPLKDDTFYLIDSGAQYQDGTTDVTRTVHFGQPSAEEKESFTRVLKGHISLGRLIFPPKTPGPAIDAIARQYLWQVGLDYGHGTGHGVGAALNVHEGPMGIPLLSSIFKRYGVIENGLEAGMIVSNEPGYYKTGEYGIRIESLVEVVPAKTAHNFNDRTYLKFRPITFVPIQTSAIDAQLMTPEDIEWLDEYHKQCYDALHPHFQGDERKKLREMTSPFTHPLTPAKRGLSS